MDRRSLGALIALNVVVLLAVLAVTVMPQPAAAQLKGRARYAMVSGKSIGRSSQDVVYVMNLTKGQVVAFLYESEKKRVTLVGGMDFARDLEVGPQRRSAK